MIPKNLMEGKQLNFDQPLLSVRRGPLTAVLPNNGRKKTSNSISSVPHLPHYKSELKSGPVRNPGVVPFQWEQIPGRPKDENSPQMLALEYPPLAPKLPPGRILNHAIKDSGATEPHAENDLPSSPDVSSLDKNVMAHEKSGEEMEESRSTVEDDDSIYVDALDTLSRSESFFLNSSVSGVSALDGRDIKPSGTFSDPRARDFMMDRFLPAAKAVASEMPQFASRKQPSVKEQRGPVKKLIMWDVQSSHCYLPPSTQDRRAEAEEEEEEEEEEDYDENENLSAKVCGLFPRFCLLNPTAGMRDQVLLPASSVCRVHRKPASSGFCSNSVNKDNRAATFFQRPTTPVHKSEADDKANNLNGKLNKISCQSDSRKSDESYEHGHIIGNGIAPYRNMLLTSFSREEKGFLGIPDDGKFSRTGKHCSGYNKYQELLADVKAVEDSDNANPTIEKTLHIDSMQMTESRSSNSSFSAGSRGTIDCRRKIPSMDYSLLDVKYVCCADGKTITRSRDLDNVDCNVSSSLEISSQEMQKDGIEEFQQNQDLKLDSDTSACLQDDNKSVMDIQHLTNTDAKETTNDSSPPILPPPLPKSPSESWLSRTLPSISSRNPSSKSHLIALRQGNLAARPLPVEQKWETIVKGSNSQHKHFQLPGALAPISEN
ncbi:hypothetical protein Ancab_007751 [Ancistrocladus abbreviatus]